MITNEDETLDVASLFKTAAMRIVGTTCTCALAVALALGLIDALSQHSLSRAAGLSDANKILSRWLPSAAPSAESQQVALLSPPEPSPLPARKAVVAALPDLTPVALPRPKPPVAPPAPVQQPASKPPIVSMPVSTPPVPQPSPEALAPEAAVAVLASLGPREAFANVPSLAVDIDEAEPDARSAAEAIPLPMPAPTRPPLPPTPAQRLKLDAKGRAKAEKCLAEAVYFEARSEGLRGQLSVAQVVMNRVFSPFYPDDVCGVVYQNANRHLGCQFTFACDGIPERVTEWSSWRRAKHIAKSTLDGKIWVAEVGRSTHYHAAYVRPNWVREMKRMARSGLHTFYRPRRWGDGSHETSWSNITHTAARAAIVD